MKRRPKIQVYRDRAGKWRWRLRAKNGLILADSGQGYANNSACWKGWKATKALVWQV